MKYIVLALIILMSFGCAQTKYPFEIDFRMSVGPEDREDFSDGFVPWVSIGGFHGDKFRLDNPEEIVIKSSEIVIVVEYPLTNTAYINASSKDGFTRMELAEHIANGYEKIYLAEDQSSAIKVIPREEREGLINRNTTDGVYGIWGHDITDLVLSGVIVDFQKGDVVVFLSIES